MVRIPHDDENLRALIRADVASEVSADVSYRLDQALGKVAADLDEKGPGTHGHITNFEGEQFLGGAQGPLALRQPFGGAMVNQRLQGVLDDGFREGARGVVGAGAAALISRSDV